MPVSPLPVSFYNRSVHETARDLLGTRLVRSIDGVRVAGYINETEAYEGESDLACHARAGKTARTEVMYGPPGRAYIYFIYGMHWMLNIVAEAEGFPAAILFRSIIPCEGVAVIAARRAGRPQIEWTNGPARLCAALSIDRNQNGVDMTRTEGGLWIEPGIPVPDAAVITGPRVGIESVPEPWRSKPWRYRFNGKTLEKPL